MLLWEGSKQAARRATANAATLLSCIRRYQYIFSMISGTESYTGRAQGRPLRAIKPRPYLCGVCKLRRNMSIAPTSGAIDPDLLHAATAPR